MGIHTGHAYSLHVYASVHTYTSIHVRIFMHTHAHVCAREGQGAGGAKRSPPVAPLSSLYRCGASLPNSSSFPHFQIHHSHPIFHLPVLYTYSHIQKFREIASPIDHSYPLALPTTFAYSATHTQRSLHYPNKTCFTARHCRSVQDSRATPGHDRQYSVVINVNKCQAGRRKSNKPVCRMVLQS